MYVYIDIYMYIYISLWICVYIYICIYIYTHAHIYCGWRKSCTTYIIGIFYDLTMHSRTPFLTLATVLSEAVQDFQDFRHWNKSIFGGFQCQC